MNISTHFCLQEFVPKKIFDQFKEKSIWFIDRRMVDFAECVRQRFGKPVIINNWHSGGSYNYRGFRDDSYYYDNGVYNKKPGLLSQHRAGRAIDISIAGVSVEEIYNDIIKNFLIYAKTGLTTVEDISTTTGEKANDGLGWIHGDCRPTLQQDILIVKP